MPSGRRELPQPEETEEPPELLRRELFLTSACVLLIAVVMALAEGYRVGLITLAIGTGLALLGNWSGIRRVVRWLIATLRG